MQLHVLAVRCWHDESGQDLTEYGLLAALISIAAVGSMLLLGEAIGGYYEYIAGEISPAN